MSVAIVDTSVFCNLLAVPGRDQERERAGRELEAHVAGGVRLLLPMAIVYETGNHIAHAGGDRHAAAARFVRWVRDSLDGSSPFAPARLHSLDDVRGWLDDFPERAAAGVGLADRSLIGLWEQQRRLNRLRRVFIWSYDTHLAGYDERP